MRQFSIFSVIFFLVFSSACATTTRVDAGLSEKDQQDLAAIIDAREADAKARDNYRNPQQTLEFFGIESDMTVAEVLPGGGWYTRILAPYLAADGSLYGINYSDDTWSYFGFFSDERIATIKETHGKFPQKAAELAGANISARSLNFGAIPEDAYGTVDAILFIRALHNLNRFNADHGTMAQAIEDTRNLLRVGGIVGVVQHAAPENYSDDWADGSKGYLKESSVIELFEAAGFELVGRSDLNANPKDQPGENDVVWRLPPSLNTGDLEGTEKEAAIAKMKAIGESNRMTLKFVKR